MKKGKDMLLLNAFSLKVVAQFPASITALSITRAQARVIAKAGIESAVGHADTAAIFGSELCVAVPPNRSTVSLEPGVTVLVGQYRGPRLPEGCSQLLEGATIQWLLVKVQ